MSDWKDTLSAIAPTLATALGGPLAGVAVAAVTKIFGLDQGTVDDVKNIVIGSKPEDLLKIKEAENAFKLTLKQLDVKIKEIEVDDRKSARGMWNADGKSVIAVLAIGTVVGFFVVVGYILRGGIKEMDANELLLAGTVVGYLAANAQQVYSYFFGSSTGSDKKSEQMAAIIKNGNSNGSNT